MLSKKTSKMKKVWASDNFAQLFLSGPTYPMAIPSLLFCQHCRCDVSVLTHGTFDILRHYQGAKHFAMDQWLRLETPGWRVLGFNGNAMPDDEVERQRAPILRTPLE